jgi:ribonuclease PH
MRQAPTRSGRAADELRSVHLETGAAPYAEGSCLITCGATRVLCTATLQDGVPDWKRGGGTGWLTAEYAMLPRATHQRTRRERGQVGGRTQEIQRLIGRALRAAVDLQLLGERTILVDCDVIVADGGTRTASITGAAVAVQHACARLLRQGTIRRDPIRQLVTAVSVGILAGEPRLDLDYAEDSAADVDLNLVALENGSIIEIQGTAERESFQRAELDRMIDLGLAGTRTLLALQKQALVS